MSEGYQEASFGKRVQAIRERNGMTRATLGGLVGRSAEWVKSIEKGRLQMPRLDMLTQLAAALGCDLAELVGGKHPIIVAPYVKEAHPALLEIREALTSYPIGRDDEEPATAAELAERVRHAWMVWHGSRANHRTRIAALLPPLLADLRYAARVHEGKERRSVLASLAEAYHLAQLFLSFQPAPDLVLLTGDRGMEAALEADNPRAIASAAWYMNHVFRDAGERHEARVELAMQAARLLDPEKDSDELARWGLLHLAVALSYAKVGRAGDAWRYWDIAYEAAQKLGRSYAHPYLIFGMGIVEGYAVTMHDDLMQGGKAVEAAAKVDLGLIPSATRRAFHIIETARGHWQRGEQAAVVHLLNKAHRESPETIRFNIFSRRAVSDMVSNPPSMLREDVDSLAQKLGVVAR